MANNKKRYFIGGNNEHTICSMLNKKAEELNGLDLFFEKEASEIAINFVGITVFTNGTKSKKKFKFRAKSYEAATHRVDFLNDEKIELIDFLDITRFANGKEYIEKVVSDEE